MSLSRRTSSRILGLIPRGAAPNPFAVAVLAVGIATAGAMFQLLDRTVLRPVPYPEAGNLVVMPLNGVVQIYSRREVTDLATLPAFAALGAYSLPTLTVVLPTGPARVEGGNATGALFRTLGVAPAAGRLLEPGDSDPGVEPVAVLGHSLWREAYGSDPSVVGRTLELVGDDGRVEGRRIVGVLPRIVGYPLDGTAVWLPLTVDPTAADFDAKNANLNPVGRLAPGRSIESAQAMVTTLVKGWVDRFPPSAFGGSAERRAAYRARVDAEVTPLSRFVAADSRALVWALMLFAAFVLAIGCANVASVQIARGIARAPEFGIRYQMGASRARLAALVLEENAWLSVLGTAGGAFLLALSSRLVGGNVPVEVSRELPAVGAATLGLLLLFALCATVALSLAGGALTAESSALRALRAGRIAPRGSFLAQRGLVAISAGMTVVLGIGAGLMFRTVRTLASRDPGFPVEGLVAIGVAPSVSDPERVHALWADLVEDLGARVDVEAAGAGYNLPLTGGRSVTDIRFADHPNIGSDERQLVEFQIASPGYVETLGLRVLEGRTFTVDDREGAPSVAVVNAAFGREYFAGGSPLGARLTAGGSESIEIVGVVSDTRRDGLDAEARPGVYYPVAQFAPRQLTLLARTGSSPEAIATGVRARLAQHDPYAIVTEARRYTEIATGSLRERTRLLAALWFFAGFGLVISALGLFGTMHGWLSGRRREIGIRSAVGAGPGAIASWVVRTGAVPVLVGGVVGVVLGGFGGRLISEQLFEVSPWDPGVVAAVLILHALIGAATLAHPARRAASAEPALELARD